MPGWALVVCVGAAACGRVGFDAPDGSGASPACDLAAPGWSTLVDDFADGNLEPNWFNAGVACLQETGGELVAAPPANMPGVYCVAYSHALDRLGCDAFFMHVAEATAPVHGSQTVVYITNTDHSVWMLMDSGGFQMAVDMNPDSIIYAPAPYDAVADAWWRFRGEPGTVYFETSPDGTTWGPRLQIAAPFSLDALQVSIGAGTYLPLPTPGAARFRCFNRPPPCL